MALAAISLFNKLQTATPSPHPLLLVPKEQVREWLLLEALDKQRRYEERLAGLEARYGMSFEAFEQRVTTAPAEQFTEWDDYIDWQATRELHTSLLARITNIRRGHFQVA